MNRESAGHGENGLSVLRVSEPNRTVVHATGVLTARTGPLLAAALDLLPREVVGEVCVELSRITEVSYAGLAVLVRADRRARRAGVTVIVTNPSPQVQNLLASTGLDRRLRIGEP